MHPEYNLSNVVQFIPNHCGQTAGDIERMDEDGSVGVPHCIPNTRHGVSKRWQMGEGHRRGVESFCGACCALVGHHAANLSALHTSAPLGGWLAFLDPTPDLPKGTSCAL